MKNIHVLIFVGYSLVSCSPKNAEVAEVERLETAVPSGDIAEGEALFQAHCGECHELPEVPHYSKEKWQKIIPAMAKEAQLDDVQERKIAVYVTWKLQQQ